MDFTQIASQIYANFRYEPTDNQKKVIEDISNWLYEEQSRSVFVINGYAGTGKTTLIAAVVGAIRDLGGQVVLLAPTGRAAKVLSRYASSPSYTIHKHIYLQDSQEGSTQFFSLGFNRSRDVIYLVDEASMINDRSDSAFGSGNLLEDLFSFVFSSSSSRIVLVGDTAQLPPIGQSSSPALNPSSLSRYAHVEYVSLTDVVRQTQQSGVLFNATLVRCMMERGISDIPHFQLGFDDFHRIEFDDFFQLLEKCYDMYGKEETIVITRSNKRAIAYNEAIRRNVLGLDEELSSSEQLMIVKNNYFYTEKNTKTNMPFIANGDIVRLERYRREETLFGLRFATAELSFLDYGEERMECKIMLDTLHSPNPSLGKEESERFFREVEQDYIDITNKRERYRQMRQDAYLNALQIKYSYAVTCHKAQGGQWKAVFIDQSLFGDMEPSTEYLRWLYTALTRSSKEVYLISYDDRFF
ncbi:MAG: AAA family ATPase [Alistipes sp.]|nr:AAA family ATPase [Candidatus Alistipes equi]